MQECGGLGHSDGEPQDSNSPQETGLERISGFPTSSVGSQGISLLKKIEPPRCCKATFCYQEVTSGGINPSVKRNAQQNQPHFDHKMGRNKCFFVVVRLALSANSRFLAGC